MNKKPNDQLNMLWAMARKAGVSHLMVAFIEFSLSFFVFFIIGRWGGCARGGPVGVRQSRYDAGMNLNPPPYMRQSVMDLEESRIREVANAGMGRSDVLAFWFGESDEVTPDSVRGHTAAHCPVA
jgi:hypothetical protein